MRNWTRKPQEVEGDYFFSGKAVMTIGVSHELKMLTDIIPISMDLKKAVEENNGLDYLQVHECDNGADPYSCLNESIGFASAALTD